MSMEERFIFRASNVSSMVLILLLLFSSICVLSVLVSVSDKFLMRQLFSTRCNLEISTSSDSLLMSRFLFLRCWQRNICAKVSRKTLDKIKIAYLIGLHKNDNTILAITIKHLKGVISDKISLRAWTDRAASGASSVRLDPLGWRGRFWSVTID